MKKKKFILAVAAVVTICFFSACKKVNEPEPLADGGGTFVKLMSGGPADHTTGQTLTGIDFVNTPQSITLAEIRRDPNSADALNTALKVAVQLDTLLLKRLNDTLTAHGDSPLLKMSDSWYTLSTGGVLGNTITLDFAPGELSKTVAVTISNAQLFNPSRTYAFPFRIVSVSNTANRISTNKALIAKVGAKNLYDGVYELTFSNYHPSSNPGYTGDKVIVHLITTALDKVKIFWPGAGEFANPAVLGGSLTYFGAQEPEYTINATTNAVTVQNVYPGAVTFYTMNPSYNSYYDPAAKKLFAKWGYSYVNGTFATGSSREWTQEFRYIGSR